MDVVGYGGRGMGEWGLKTDVHESGIHPNSKTTALPWYHR